jgi:hypothetical protein
MQTPAVVSVGRQIACRRGHDDDHPQNTQSVWPFDITVLKYSDFVQLPSIVNSRMSRSSVQRRHGAGYMLGWITALAWYGEKLESR